MYSNIHWDQNWHDQILVNYLGISGNKRINERYGWDSATNTKGKRLINEYGNDFPLENDNSNLLPNSHRKQCHQN